MKVQLMKTELLTDNVNDEFRRKVQLWKIELKMQLAKTSTWLPLVIITFLKLQLFIINDIL